MATKAKYYVVWAGREPGIYTSWATCEQQVKGVAAARYKAFASREEAARAFVEGDTPASAPQPAKATRPARSTRSDDVPNPPDWRQDTVLPLPPEVRADALAVDAACSGNPGRMEYRGIDLRTGAVAFHLGPLFGTNNIGEFLAIVHALALLQKEGRTDTAIYSDSRNALLWVKARKCRTKLPETRKSAAVHDLIRRAEAWLRENDYDNPLLKWDTKRWGEVPADFGRK